MAFNRPFKDFLIKKANKKPSVEQIQLPYMSPLIQLDDLKGDKLKLLDEKEIEHLNLALQGKPDGRYSKTDLKKMGIKNPKYGIIKTGGNLFTIYGGSQQNKMVGEGGFGGAKLMQNVETGHLSILKVVNIKYRGIDRIAIRNAIKAAKEAIHKEADNLKQVGMLDFVQDDYVSTKKGNRMLVGMQLAKGQELWKLINPNPDPDEKKDVNVSFNSLQRLTIAKNAANEVKKAHERGVIHMDIKPENFMCDPGTCDVKLIDYGMARIVQGNEKAVEASLQGTPQYWAPEMLDPDLDQVPYNEQTKLYALGMTIADSFHLTQEAMSYRHRNYSEMLARQVVVTKDSVQYKKNSLLPEDEESKKAILDLVTKATHKDPAQRGTLAEFDKKLEQIIDQLKQRKLNVGIVFVDDFLGLPKDEQAKAVQMIAQNMLSNGINAAALCDRADKTPPRDIKDYLQATQLLQQHLFVNIAPMIFKGPEQDVKLAATQYFDRHFQAKSSVHVFTDKGLTFKAFEKGAEMGLPITNEAMQSKQISPDITSHGAANWIRGERNDHAKINHNGFFAKTRVEKPKIPVMSEKNIEAAAMAYREKILNDPQAKTAVMNFLEKILKDPVEKTKWGVKEETLRSDYHIANIVIRPTNDGHVECRLLAKSAVSDNLAIQIPLKIVVDFAEKQKELERDTASKPTQKI